MKQKNDYRKQIADRIEIELSFMESVLEDLKHSFDDLILSSDTQNASKRTYANLSNMMDASAFLNHCVRYLATLQDGEQS